MTPGPRYIAKQTTRDGKRVWGAYDRKHGCWPIILNGVSIPQWHPDEQTAQEVADDLCANEAFYERLF